MSDAVRSGALAIITGAASGIGAALADEAKQAGMALLLSDIDEGKLKAKAAALGADYMVCNVAEPGDVERLANRAASIGVPIGAVFANAGVMKTAPLTKTSPEDWAFMISVNLTGMANMVRSFVPLMTEQETASRFIATSSVAGLVSAPLTGAYNATKHGVVAICETLFQELRKNAPHVGVSVICPGAVQTDILNLEKYGMGEAPSARSEALAKLMAEKGLSAQELAEKVFIELKKGKFWIFPQNYVFDRFEARYQAIINGYGAEWLSKSKADG